MQKSTDQRTASTSPLQWDDVRVFLALAQSGSLSAAARILKVEHTTVARRIQSLEDSLGLRLFDRLPRGWSLTAEGETLAAQGKRMEEEAMAFSRAAQGVSSLSGSVRLSAPPVMSSHFLAPRLVALRRQWPGIDLEIIGESRQANLARGEADLAVRMTRPQTPGLVARLLGHMGYGLYATPAYARTLAENWEFLGYDDSLRHLPQQQWLERFANGRRFALRSNDLAAFLQAARAGLGVAALPHFLGRTDPSLIAVETSDAPTPREIWLVLHPDVRRSPRVRAVANSLGELFTQSSPLFQAAGP